MTYEDPTTSAGLRSLQGSLQQYNRLQRCQGAISSIGASLVLLSTMVEGVHALQVPDLGLQLNIYDEIVLTADAGFNSESSSKTVLDRRIDAHFADPQIRKRDPRFARQQKHRARSVDRWGTTRTRKYFAAADFHFDEDGNHLSERNSHETLFHPYVYAEHCGACSLKSKCIRAKKRQIRRIKILDSAPTAMQRMCERFDSERDRRFYKKRMGTVEPVFGNVRHNLRLDRFSFRG